MKRNELLNKVKMMNEELIHETEWKAKIDAEIKIAQTTLI